MKGSPMQRNFGIGSPLHQNEEETKKERRKRQRTERKDLRLDQRIERLESKKSKKKETTEATSLTEPAIEAIAETGATPSVKTKETSFSDAFSGARDAGEKEFTYEGKQYHTKTKSEVQAGKTKNQEVKESRINQELGKIKKKGNRRQGTLGPYNPKMD